MDYGALIGQAWRLTTRHRFLWILGLFAASTVGSCSTNAGGGGSNWQTDGRDFEGFSPQIEQVFRAVLLWFTQNAGLVLSLVLLGVLVGLAIAIVSFIAQGAMARATYDLAEGRPSSLGQAWSAGVRTFWRYLGLTLLVIFIGVVIAVVVAAVVGVAVALAFAVESLRGPLAILGGVLGVLLALIAIPVAIGFTVAVAYAQRAIVVYDLGPWDALASGLRLLRARLGPSFLLWLINIALSIGAGLLIGLVIVVLLIPLGGIGALLWSTGGGLNAGLVVYGVLALLVVILAGWGLSGVMNAYFWNYWTLAYLNLIGPRGAAPAQQPPADLPPNP